MSGRVVVPYAALSAASRTKEPDMHALFLALILFAVGSIAYFFVKGAKQADSAASDLGGGTGSGPTVHQR